MRIVGILILALIFTSCQFSDNGIETLNSVINEKWNENIRLVNLTAKRVEDSGNRPLDVEVLNESKFILELRGKFNIPEVADSLDNQMKILSAIRYLEEIVKYTDSHGIRIDTNILVTVKELAAESMSEKLKKRLIFLNILKLEAQIFDDRLMHVRVNCGFCYSFNFFTKKDSLRIGSTHESIVSIADLSNGFQDFSFENIHVTLNDEIMPIEFVSIGSSVYMKFVVNRPGKYIYEGDLRVRYEGVHNEYLCKFRYDIFGIE